MNTDASNHGIGAVLNQGEKLIAYASRTLSKAEKNYCVIREELANSLFELTMPATEG